MQIQRLIVTWKPALFLGALVIAGAGGCGEIVEADSDAGEGDDDPDAGGLPDPDALADPDARPLPDAPPDGDTPPPEAIYERGSIAPEFKLMRDGQFSDFRMPALADSNIFDEPVRATFEASSLVGNPGITNKLSIVGQQIDDDNADSDAQPVGGIVPSEQADRAHNMPFRGKPSDIELSRIGGERFALVTLGGEISIPGNQVELLDVTDPTSPQSLELITVGIRPQSIAATREIDGVQPGIAFVCNEYSNYISVIDVGEGELIDGVEIPTDYLCKDLVLADPEPQSPDPLEQDLYVANHWAGSVHKYELEFIADDNDNIVDVVRRDGEPEPAHQPSETFANVGSNPMKLQRSVDERKLFVANSRGGDVAMIDLQTGDTRVRALDGPAIGLVDAQQSAFVLTTTIHRGFPSTDEQNILPGEVTQPGPIEIDGQVVHPGARFNDTVTYNFEDLRNQIVQIDPNFEQDSLREYTDVVEADRNHFPFDEKLIIEGAVGADMIRGGAGELFVAWKGSDVVQQFEVDAGAPDNLNLEPGDFVVDTDIAPKAIAFDEEERTLFVVSWGSETLQVFDVDNAQVLGSVDLEYAAPSYPATDIERGQWGFVSAKWSNDGTKSCASCHVDELLADGIPFANGTRAPTVPNKVIPNWNLVDTKNYLWNNSSPNNSSLSLAFTAQTRGDCEIATFGFAEGAGMVSLDSRQGLGDNNQLNAFDASSIRDQCLDELASRADGFDVNADFIGEIAGLIVQERQEVAEAFVRDVTESELGIEGIGRAELAAFIDWYGAAWVRMPPNPTHFLNERGLLEEEQSDRIAQGAVLFQTAQCANCHIPEERFRDGRSHGPGWDAISDIVETFEDDMIDQGFLAGQGDQLPNEIVNALAAELDAGQGADDTPNIHTALDLFVPFCFDDRLCLEFEDPRRVSGARLDDALEVLAVLNLGDVERGFIPGNPTGSAQNAKVATPSLMGVWWQPNYMRPGTAQSIVEGIVGPGHPALASGQIGYAVNQDGDRNVHGVTDDLSADDIAAIVEYVESIQ